VAQYKDGDSRVINGVTYTRQNGQWLPPASPFASPKLPGELTGQQLNNAGQGIHNRKDEATLPYDIRSARAQAEKAEIDAKTAKEQYDAQHPSADKTGLYGADYLKTLSASDQNMVKALSEGRLAFPQGAALRSPFWQEKLSQVAQFDPTFDATNFNARAKGRANAIAGKLGQSNNALNTALGHLQTLSDQIDGTASHGGFPFATTVNHIQNAYARGHGDAGITNFTDTASKLADELEAVYRNGGGAEQGVVRQLRNLDPDMSRDQKVGVIHNAMDLLASKMAANLSQYDFGTGGKPAWDMLDPHAKQIFEKNAPDIRDKYFALAPTAQSNNPPPGPGFVPPPTGANNNLRSSVDGFSDKPDQESADFWDRALHNGVPYRTALKQWQSDIKFRGLSQVEPPDPAAYHKAASYISKYPNIEYHPFQSVTRTPIDGLWDQGAHFVASSGPGAGAGHFLNAATGGLPERAAGDQGAYFDAVSRQEHLGFSTAGDIGGTVYGAYRLNKGLGPVLGKLPGAAGRVFTAAKVADNPALAEAAPAIASSRQALATDTLFGGLSGSIQNPDHPIEGAGLGALAMGGGNLAGRYTLGPALGYLGETGPGKIAVNAARKGGAKLRGMFGGSGSSTPFNPPAPLNPGESMILNQAGRSGLNDLHANLRDAGELNLPYSLADADTRLRMLAGSAARKSPNVRKFAEDVLGPRQMGQAERAVSLIDSQLAPVGDVPTIKAQALSRARDASAPLYAKAKSRAPANLANEPSLSEVLARPSAERGLRKGYQIAMDEGSNPAELSFATGPNGETILNGNPSWQTLHYVRRGLDEEIASAVDPVTGKVKPGMTDSQGAMIKLRSDLDREIGRINPAFKAADARYADFAGQGAAAERGAAATGIRVTPEQTQSALNANFSDLPYFRKGYASSMADAVDRTRLSADPYDVVYGSPAQQQKLGIVFPKGAERFSRARKLERDMSKTHYEVLGGSPTASRMEADKLFEGPGAAVTDLAFSAATGAPSPTLVARGLRGVNDWWQLGRGAKRADEIGNLLLDTDPRVANATLRYLEWANAQRKGYVQNARALGGMFGAPIAYGATR
jgi:hypothetical protein